MPPSEPPKGTKSRGRRKPRQTQPPSSTARQNAAFGSRPAKPLPKPVVRPVARPKPAPQYKPTATQLKTARAQRQQHVSQGKEVEGTANRQRQQAQTRREVAQRQAAAAPYVSQGQAVASQARRLDIAQQLTKSTKVPHTVIGDTIYRRAHKPVVPLPFVHTPRWLPVKDSGAYDQTKAIREEGVQKATAAAPALKILDQTTRVSHALAAGTKAAIKGEDVPRAVKRGAQLKDRTQFSDVLKSVGVKNKGVAAAGGFALDVALDPTTYLTGGLGSVEKRAATTAAKDATRQALKAGMTEEGAATVAKQAAKRAVAKAPAGRGVTVKFAGREVPGVRRATAATARGVRVPVRKVAPVASRAVPARARRAAREVAPSVRQAGVSEAAHTGARQATRTARATTSAAEAKALQIAQELRRKLSDEDYVKVADAVDRNDFSKLTPELAQSAHLLRSALKGSRRLSRRAGVAAGHVAGDASRFLSKQDLKRLEKSTAAETRSQKRVISRTVTKEQASRESALLAEQAAKLGTRQAQAVTGERAVAQARAAVVRTRKTLRAEVAKPVTKRRGVATLEANVRAAENAWRGARHASPAVASRGVVRAQQSAGRYERRAASTLEAQRRLAAAEKIPKLETGETHAAYLQRVINHAAQHNLPLVKARAEKLLAKVPEDVARGYFPREFEPRVLKKLGLTDEEATTRTVRAGAAPSRTVGQTTAGFARNDPRALRTVNPERAAAGKEPFSTNVPLVALNHLKSAARAASEGEFAKSMAKLGRKVSSADELQPGEGIYKLGYQSGKFGLHEVRNVPAKATRGGQYVALDKQMLTDMQGAVRQVRSGNPIGQTLDKVTGRWKRLATATPGFHIRNILGDTAQAYLAAPGHQLPRNIGQAGKAVRRASQQARSLTPPASHATIKIGGERQPVDAFLKGARENGVLDAGYIGKEVHDLVTPSTEKTGKVKRGKGTINRWMTNRENLMRLATYKAGLDRGMKPADAADLANHFHIDYGDLSDTERRYLRRVFPFYTWTARTLPVMVKSLATQPGKFATIEKAREETESGFGLNEEAVRRGMSESISRQVPVVIKVGSGALGVSASLPVTLLNELPTGASKDDLSAYLSELGRFGFQMLNPLFKVPIEQQAGVSLYTKRPIEDPRRPLTAAPSWVQWLPASVKRELEVTPDYEDKRTGKKTWGWRGQADYWSRQIPGAPQQVATVASGGRPGQPKDVGVAAIGAAGVRVDSLNAAAVKHSAEVKVLQQLAKLNRRAAELNQQGIHSANATPEYRSLRKQINALTKQVRPRKTKRSTTTGPLPLGGGSGGKLPLGGGSGGKLPLG